VQGEFRESPPDEVRAVRLRYQEVQQDVLPEPDRRKASGSKLQGPFPMITVTAADDLSSQYVDPIQTTAWRLMIGTANEDD
jgi:hypothetical protein